MGQKYTTSKTYTLENSIGQMVPSSYTSKIERKEGMEKHSADSNR